MFLVRGERTQACYAKQSTQAMDNIGSATLLTELRATNQHVSTAKLV